MKKFQNLFIKLRGNEEETINEIAKSLPKVWVRDSSREHDLQITSGGKYYCFEFKANNFGRSKLLAKGDKDTLTVVNIVPVDKTELSPEEYNYVLGEFVRTGLDGRFEYSLTAAEVGLEDVVSLESARLFLLFSAGANKSTGRTHPADEARWLAFVLSTVKENEFISADDLAEFLKEGGWDEDTAHDLADDFSYACRVMHYALMNGGAA